MRLISRPGMSVRGRSATLASVHVTQIHGPWQVNIVFSPDGRPVELHVQSSRDATPDDVAAGLGSGVLRRIDWQGAATQWRDENRQARNRELYLEAVGPKLAEYAREGVTDLYLSALSAVYVELVDNGQQAPAGFLSGYTGKAAGTITNHLKEARRRGLLTAIGGGKAGGKLTEKARALLGKAQEGT